MKLNILIGKAKILGIENDEVENILKFIELHESLTLDLKKCGYCKNYKICANSCLNNACENFKYKHEDDFE